MSTDPLPSTALRPDTPAMPPCGPDHIAIIMDGNGRWAEARGMPRVAGHKVGVEALRRTVRAAGDLGIKHLTVYSFSTENWSRPPSEVAFLMGLLRRFIQQDLADLHSNGVRLRMIGSRDRVEPDLLLLIDEAVAMTAGNTALQLHICFNYGSRDEITNAARRLAEQATAGLIEPAEITPEVFAAALATPDIPDPDLLIRTGSEVRLSNFLLWQLAYAELVFFDVAWPDFGRDHLEAAIAQYRKRTRRFGGLAVASG